MPLLLAALLVGAGLYGVLARRHPVLVLLGLQFVLGGVALLLLTGAQLLDVDPFAGGGVLTLLLVLVGVAQVLVVLVLLVSRRRPTDATEPEVTS